jgi:hypothetical protein
MLPFFHREAHFEASVAKLVVHQFHSGQPVGIEFADVQIEAQIRELLGAFLIGLRQVTGKTGHRQKILRVGRGNVKGADASV